MDLTISSNLEADYLLIKVSGSVADIKDMKFLTRQIYDEITKYNSKKVVIDQTKNKPLKSLIYQIELVDFYNEEFPIEVRKLRIPEQIATLFRSKSPPYSDPNRHPIPIQIATPFRSKSPPLVMEYKSDAG